MIPSSQGKVLCVGASYPTPSDACCATNNITAHTSDALYIVDLGFYHTSDIY